MNHYFSQKEPTLSSPKTIFYTFKDHKYTFTTDSGVFSINKIDNATDILLNTIPPLQGSLLDMGCGYGCIGIVLAKEYNLTLTQVDINPRALRLTKENATLNNVISNVIESDGFNGLYTTQQLDRLYDTIAINPPIHAGKAVVFSMYENSFNYLKRNGCLYVVIYKKHGALSTIKHLDKIFGECRILYKKKGIFVLGCIKR